MLHAQVGPADRETLCHEMRTAADAKWYCRLKIIDSSELGYSMLDLARPFDLSEATIRCYIHRFDRGGMAGLRPQYGQGRPPTPVWTEAQWQDELVQSPAHLPLLASKAHNWTQALLRQYLKAYHQLEVSQPTIAKSLRRTGIRWRRAKLRVYSPDPLYLVKR